MASFLSAYGHAPLWGVGEFTAPTSTALGYVYTNLTLNTGFQHFVQADDSGTEIGIGLYNQTATGTLDATPITTAENAIVDASVTSSMASIEGGEGVGELSTASFLDGSHYLLMSANTTRSQSSAFTVSYSVKKLFFLD